MRFNPVTAQLHRDYPLLWYIAQRYDFAERLGGCTDPLMAEVDAALRELSDARQWLSTTRKQPTGMSATLKSSRLPARKAPPPLLSRPALG